MNSNNMTRNQSQGGNTSGNSMNERSNTAVMDREQNTDKQTKNHQSNDTTSRSDTSRSEGSGRTNSQSESA